jgi:tetratricopeptide (TPR) repeat protein
MLILLGNTYYAQEKFTDALDKYNKAIVLNSNDYYALSSAARCEKRLGDDTKAKDHFHKCLEAIERSGDLRKKRERITRAVIAVIASNAAYGCDDNAKAVTYSREAHELLGGKLEVENLSPKFFSASTTRLVKAADLLNELALQEVMVK